MKLMSRDFPVIAIGNRVYARNQSSPVATAQDDETAAELALRLNRDDQCYPTDEDGGSHWPFPLVSWSAPITPTPKGRDGGE